MTSDASDGWRRFSIGGAVRNVDSIEPWMLQDMRLDACEALGAPEILLRELVARVLVRAVVGLLELKPEQWRAIEFVLKHYPDHQVTTAEAAVFGVLSGPTDLRVAALAED